MTRIVLVFIIFCCSTAIAQDKQNVRVSGTIINAEDLMSVPFVHIINISKRSGVTSDQYGRFSFEIPKGDTIVFSSVGFKLKMLSFRDSSEHAYLNLTIRLSPETITLDPVEIRAYNLEEILNRVKEKEFTMQQPSRPESVLEQKERREPSAMGLGASPYGGATLEGAITAFANLFSREFKQRQRLKAILEKEAMNNRYLDAKKQLEDNYREIASRFTGLNGEDFDYFCRLYMPDFDFLLRADDYEVSLRLYQDFRDYRFKYKLEEVSLDELMENAKFRK